MKNDKRFNKWKRECGVELVDGEYYFAGDKDGDYPLTLKELHIIYEKQTRRRTQRRRKKKKQEQKAKG